MTKPFINLKNIPVHTGLIPDDSSFSINQKDATGKLGWRTVKVSMEQIYSYNKEFFKTVNFIDGLNIDYTGGLKGKGTIEDPLSLDLEWMSDYFYPLRGVNLTQIGNVWDFTVNEDGTFEYRDIGFTYSSGNINLLSITKPVDVYINGVQKTFEIASGIQLNREELDPTKPIYFYFEKKLGDIFYFITTKKLPETSSLTCAGIWALNSTTPLPGGPKLKPFIRIDRYRFSQVPVGSAIPVSIGFPFSKQYTLWE